MRKKSHVSLVKYIMRNFKEEKLNRHKKSLIAGSILPDCIPSFITRRHTIEETFHILRKEIKKLTEIYGRGDINSYYCRHLGIITHYVADYFTYPHNAVFDGTLSEHCSYEEQLKRSFRKYVKSSDAQRDRSDERMLLNAEDICNYIKQRHYEYMEAIEKEKEVAKAANVNMKHDVMMDCKLVADTCFVVADAILQIFEEKISVVQSTVAVC